MRVTSVSILGSFRAHRPRTHASQRSIFSCFLRLGPTIDWPKCRVRLLKWVGLGEEQYGFPRGCIELEISIFFLIPPIDGRPMSRSGSNPVRPGPVVATHGGVSPPTGGGQDEGLADETRLALFHVRANTFVSTLRSNFPFTVDGLSKGSADLCWVNV